MDLFSVSLGEALIYSVLPVVQGGAAADKAGMASFSVSPGSNGGPARALDQTAYFFCP
jgi:hypothetical protein